MSLAGGEALREFDQGGPAFDMEEHVSVLEAMPELLSDAHIARLWALLQGRSKEEVDYGPDFDIGDEVRMQILAVRAMRRSVLTDSGAVRPGVPARELKEVVTASNTLLQTLLKTHEKIMSYDRMRAIEEAVVASIQSQPDEQREAFLLALKENLAAIE